MPNWKKIALSGSSPEFSSLTVDNTITASTVTSSLLRLDENGTGLRMTNIGAFDNASGSFRVFSNQDLILSTNGQDGTAVTFDETTKDATFVGNIIGSISATNGVVSGSSQIASDISGSFTSTSESIAADIASLVTDSGSFSTRVTAIEGFSSSIESSIYSYTGSFTGDGSGLTGVLTNLTEEVTVSQTFTSATTASVNHLFGTKDVIVTVYDDNDDQFIPSRINTPDTNNVNIYMDPATTGRVVVAKGGHLVSGSIHKHLMTSVTSSTITHNLQEEFPVVQVYESASREMFIPETIKSIDQNNTQVVLSELIDCYVVIKR